MAGFHSELNRLSKTKKIVSYLPERLKFRALKALYNYEADDIHGIDLVAPLQNDGLVCFINTKDIIGWKIFFYGEYESSTNKIIKKYINPGDVVIEAGANLGSETLLLSRLVGDTGKVYGFEPNPFIFERLKMNLAINELKNVDIHDIALGESNEIIYFNIYTKGFCNPGMSSKYISNKDTRKISVPQMTLDAFVAKHNVSKVDFIKMDIQGAEIDLFNGAAATISKFRPLIFTEADQYCLDMKVLHEKLTSSGYKVYLIKENENIFIPSPAEAVDGNWLGVYGK
ncbi:MAG: FkbM family methyltransferase [Taibaiella sp.]|nr:FkbM family methyltransferase [Taibaiella sp.]